MDWVGLRGGLGRGELGRIEGRLGRVEGWTG